jgi:PKD repeat protein
MKTLLKNILIIFILVAALLISFPACKKNHNEDPPPVTFKAEFAASPNLGTVPFTANFTDKSIGEPDSWIWDIQNDGIVDDTIQDPSYTYQEPGFYSVSLIAANTTESDTALKVNYIGVTTNAAVLSYTGFQTVHSNDAIDIPVLFGNSITLGAFTLKMLYDSFRLHVTAVNSSKCTGMVHNIDTLNGTILIAWSSAIPVTINPQDDFLNLAATVIRQPDSSCYPLVIGNPTEFADGNAQLIEGVELVLPVLNSP